MKILVSACLLGSKCRYDGEARPCRAVMELSASHDLVPVCPERLAGLFVPREPAEISEGRVVARGGRDLTEEFERGARLTLEVARRFGCGLAILKERSPSCGSSFVHDGSFSGRVIPGRGVAAAYLTEHGLRVCSEENFEKMLVKGDCSDES